MMRRTKTKIIKAADAVGDEVPNVDKAIVPPTRGSLQHTTLALVAPMAHMVAPMMSITKAAGLVSSRLWGY